MVRPDKVVCANAGDCRAVLGRKEPAIGKRKRETVAAVPLSIDHNCRDPREQVALFKVNTFLVHDSKFKRFKSLNSHLTHVDP